MIVTAPSIQTGGPSRALVLKQWFKIIIQVLGPNTLIIGTSKDEAGRNSLAYGIQDGIQLNNTNSNVPFQIWWKGELWVSGSDPANGCAAVIIVPGLAPSLYEAGGDLCIPEED